MYNQTFWQCMQSQFILWSLGYQDPSSAEVVHPSLKLWHFPAERQQFEKVKQVQVRQSISIHRGVQDRNWCQSCSEMTSYPSVHIVFGAIAGNSERGGQARYMLAPHSRHESLRQLRCLGSHWRLPISMPSLCCPQRAEEGVQHTCQYLLFQQNASFNTICSWSKYVQKFEVVTLTVGLINNFPKWKWRLYLMGTGF